MSAATRLDDDATLPAEMAALYLRILPADLAESHKPRRIEGRVDKNAKVQAPPTAYTLGTLRALALKQAGPSPLEAVSKAGLLGWMTMKMPFFAELEPRVKRGRRVLIGNAWGHADAEREACFVALLAGRIRFTWLSCSEAATSLWSDEARLSEFAARGLALLEAETRAIHASIGATQSLNRPPAA